MLDRLAATAFVGCDSVDADEFAALTRAAAASLADDDTSAARASRRRLIARLTAIEKTTMTVLMGMLGESVRAGLDDEHARRIAKVLDGLANSSCRRLTMLLGAAEQRASVVSIENALVKVDAV